MRRNVTRVLVIAALVALIPTIAITWGNEGHMAINRAATQKIPADMPQFVKNGADHIAYMGPEPDRWREKLEATLKSAQEPEHFMDMELVEFMQALPKDRFQFIRDVYENRTQMQAAKADQRDIDMMTPEKVGLQPYAAMEAYDRLKVSFREYRKAQKEGRSTADAEAAVLHYAGWLGHYVGDAANPLHTTVKYNGWVGPNPNGYSTERDVHWKMEGLFVSRNLDQLPFADLVAAPKKLDHPFEDYIAYMRESQGKVERVYQIEKACGFEGAGTPESREFMRQQLGRGAQMLLNLWYTAWVDSAVEPPPYVPPKSEKPRSQKSCSAAVPAEGAEKK
ncbi:MAG TPA: nuclease [Clostridia bacterium]|nr:nuclease [Clostridia bacterium]